MTNPPTEVLVTDEMIEAGEKAFVEAHRERYPFDVRLRLAYRAMHSARPLPDTGPSDAVALCAQIEADAVSGLRYIEHRYGRLDGVGWDRVFDAHDKLFALTTPNKGELYT